MKDRLVLGSRGYGYWCWKPQIVLQALRDMHDGDVLLYADAGCHLNPCGLTRLMDYYELAKEHGIVAFQSRTLDVPPKHLLTDSCWSKGDLLDYFGAREDDSIVATGQLGGGVFLLKKDSTTIAFYEQFKQVFVQHFHLCDDSPSISPNLPGFVENRHDQSVFSILGKKAGVHSLSSLEYSLFDVLGDWRGMRSQPVWALHDKGGIRSLFPDWFKRLVHKCSGGRL